jgi:hypothetical protein
MKRIASLGLLVAISSPAAWAQEATSTPEPAVQRTVIEDRGARIEELRVRGELRSVVVYPKGGAAAYEIITPSGARDLSVDANNLRGAAGKRVWHVLSF